MPGVLGASYAPEGLTPADRRYSCAAESQLRSEPVLGSASTTRGFLLVEEPGPWGPGGVPSSRLGEGTTAALQDVAASIGAKLLLVRRPGTSVLRSGAGAGASAERVLMRVSVRRGRERVITRTCAVADVVEAARSRDGWHDLDTTDGGPLLVCTHGRKDWCCARRGRPLAAALAELAPSRVWECSHLGGDRFAANLLSLPTGWTYGRVDTGDAAAVVTATARGRVLPGLLRGRCCDAMVVQAADVLARLELGRDEVRDLVPVSAAREGEDAGAAWRVVFDTSRGQRLAVRVRQRHVESAQRLTCGAAAEQHARTWELLDVAPVAVP
ncbi:sucrase ferredoxin [Streptomyces sp. NP160]|uniref:sucrase ferredoxin n=1 Tax=Streptomyces sp. NP160 TaxID=2586637 RepID=UPI00111B1CE1|nr:sucrase ferredoxin [Streptomyces sp. NP160]TNM64319.1 sucrase ferredoxin [Streptomyces sp. NP160]